MVSKTNNLSGHMSNLLIDWYYSVLSEVVHWDILWESKTDKVYINKCSDLHFIEYSQRIIPLWFNLIKKKNIFSIVKEAT